MSTICLSLSLGGLPQCLIIPLPFSQSTQPPQQQHPQGSVNGDSGNMQQQQQQQQMPPVVVAQSQPPNVVMVPNNNQSNHNAHPSGGMGPNSNKSHGPPRHRYPQQHQQHMPMHSYGAEPPPMGPPPPQSTMMQPPQMVLKGQPPPPHAIVMVPPQAQGQLLVVQGMPPPQGGPKMMPQRPPRGRDETVQDLKNFQDNYVLATNPNASPGLAGPQSQQPPPMMYAPPPNPNAQQLPPPPTPQQQQQQQQDEMKSQGVPSSPQPTSSLPPPVVPVHHHQGGQRPGPTPSPAANQNNNARPAGQVQDTASGPLQSTGAAGGSAEKHVTEAKKSVLNPQAKPFTPRTPSTPNPSRPHTPQSAGPQMVQSGSVPGSMPGAPNGNSAQPTYQQAYLMQQKPQFPNGGRMRYVTPASAAQVQAATGSPITIPGYMYQPHPQQHFATQQPYPMVSTTLLAPRHWQSINSRYYSLPPANPDVHAGPTATDAIPNAEPALYDTVAGHAVPPAGVPSWRRAFAAIPTAGWPAVPHHVPDDRPAADDRAVPSECAAPVPRPVHYYERA